MATLARWQATIVDDDGNVLPSASVEVRTEATSALTTIYSDRAGTTPIANPGTADSEGFFFFYASGGAYKITATSGSTTRIWRYVGVGTAQEYDGPVRVSAAADYYVRTDGSDSNTGQANTALGAWASIAHAVGAVQVLELQTQDVIIHVADGTYNETSTAFVGPLVGGTVTLQGNTATPANVILNYSGGANIYCQGNDPFTWSIVGFKIINSGDFSVDVDGGFIQTGLIDWGASFGHIFCHNQGMHYSNQAETCSAGTSGFHWAGTAHSFIRHRGPSLTFTGNPTFTQALLVLSDGANAQLDGMTFTGTFTGKPFSLSVGCSVLTGSNNLGYFPALTSDSPPVTAHGDLLGGFFDNYAPPTLPKPVTYTADHVMTADEFSMIFNKGSSATLTLLDAATYPGRTLLVKTITAQTVISSTTNVIPLIGGSPSTAILSGTAGKWALLQSNDGNSPANWIIMTSN